MTHDEVVDMKDFNEWWDRDIIRSSPFRRGSPAYWAWAAWEAALREHAMSEVQRLGQEIQPEQEPVAFASHGVVNWIADKQFQHEAHLYSAPQRTWVGLTKEEKEKIKVSWIDITLHYANISELMDTIEQSLKEKNT
jgi:hypothetical protein